MTGPDNEIGPVSEDKKKLLNIKNVGIGVFLVMFFSWLGEQGKTDMTKQSPSPEEITQKKDFSDSIDAQVWAKEYIKARLKAPSTAKWQNTADVAVAKIEGSKNKWIVQGYVDSQNGYGAMLRMKYWATMAKQSNGKWSMIKLQTEP